MTNVRQGETPTSGRLHEPLGQGGIDILHRATDRLTGKTVALKQVFLPTNQPLFADPPVVETVQSLRLALAHEFQTLASMRHPCIITVLDYGFGEDKRPFPDLYSCKFND